MEPSDIRVRIWLIQVNDFITWMDFTPDDSLSLSSHPLPSIFHHTKLHRIRFNCVVVNLFCVTVTFPPFSFSLVRQFTFLGSSLARMRPGYTVQIALFHLVDYSLANYSAPPLP